MTGEDASARPASKQSDVLLWLAAAGVAAVAAAWLLMLQPWRGDAPPPAPERRAAETPAPAAAGAEVVPESADRATPSPAGTDTAAESADRIAAGDASTAAGGRLESGFEDPLTTAQLALEAGLLLEPEGSSAWSLFASVLADDPDNETALAGRGRVAELLVARADTALEQGRVDDARAVAERVLASIDEHAGAAGLAARIEAATRPPPEPEPEPEPPPVEPEPAVVAAIPEPDPVETAFAAAHASFERALDASRLLTPAEASARHFVAVMRTLDADDERARAAAETLFAELLSRSRQALEALDTTAARTWIDEAEGLGIDSAAVERARTQLVDTLIARESARRLPVSSLELTEYVPPTYPSVARRREMEGWVDVEFTVGTDGTTRNVVIVEGSHDTTFHEETLAAVAEWRFEPRVFMNRRIDQRVYTRIRYDLD